MVNFYNDRVCLNCLAGSVENAKEIYQAGEKHVLVGVLSSKYPSVEVTAMGFPQNWQDEPLWSTR